MINDLIDLLLWSLTNHCHSLIRGIKRWPRQSSDFIGANSILDHKVLHLTHKYITYLHSIYRRPHSIIWIIGVISVCFQFHVHIVRRVQRKYGNHLFSSWKKIWVDKYVEFGKNIDPPPKKNYQCSGHLVNSHHVSMLCILLFFHPSIYHLNL